MTIRKKLLVAMALVLAFVTFLGLVYYRSLVTIGNRLMLVESIDDLGVAIADLRRDEKNYLLYQDRNSALAWLSQLGATRRALERKKAELTELEGKDYSTRLTDAFSTYGDLVRQFVSAGGDEVTAGEIRRKGQELAEYSRGVIRAERRRIDTITKSSFRLFLLSLLVIVIAGLGVAAIIARDIVAPLTKIERATRQVSQGSYVPIGGIRTHDEIGRLAEAFNHMVQQIEKSQDELVQAGKLASLGTLTSGVAHEINNPLNNISMIAQTYAQQYDKLRDDERIQFMSEIDAQCERAKETVINLLDFSRVRPRTYAFDDIAEVVKDSLKLVENQLTLNNVECELRMAAGLPAVHMNANRIKQVLINLFTNAIKAMPQGGRMMVAVALSAGGRHVEISITDTGVGIPPAALPHIFDPFFTTGEVGKGTGLGLSVSYSIIKRHGGTISVSSEEGKGSTFTVALPVEGKEARHGESAEDLDRR